MDGLYMGAVLGLCAGGGAWAHAIAKKRGWRYPWVATLLGLVGAFAVIVVFFSIVGKMIH